MLPRLPTLRTGLTVVAITLACAIPAAAQDGGSHPLDSILEFMNLKTDPGPMPDFVQQSRHDLSQDGYIPAGAKPASRELKMKTPAEVKALTAELDAARAAQVAGKRPKPLAAAPTAGPKPGRPLPLARKTQQATNR
jgi:hypothetical protein